MKEINSDGSTRVLSTKYRKSCGCQYIIVHYSTFSDLTLPMLYECTIDFFEFTGLLELIVLARLLIRSSEKVNFSFRRRKLFELRG